MTIDHLCIAVRDLDNAIEYWERTFGYIQKTRMVINTVQKVKVVFLTKEGSLPIKLIEPTMGNQALQNFVNRGGGFHHICFRCDDVTEAVKDLKGKGLITLAGPQPGEAFNNHNIAFLLAKYGLNIEVIDTDERAEVIDTLPDAG